MAALNNPFFLYWSLIRNIGNYITEKQKITQSRNEDLNIVPSLK